MVTVYTKDNCAPCKGTKKFLTDHGVEFIEKNVQHDPAAFDELSKIGFNSVPVIVTQDDFSFAGLNLQELRKLV
jgi:glutaredoxin-like protein NrdH